MNTREIALTILVEIDEKKGYSNILLNKSIPDNIDIRDENFIRELVYGVIENRAYIDYMIRKLSNIRIKKIHIKILNILRIGVFQIVFLDKIPDSATVNESVNLAKKVGHKGSIGFVNGILRNLTRKKENIMNIDVKNKEEYLSIKYSHPLYLVSKWIKDYGYEFTESLLIANNSKAKLNIRVNTLKINKHEMKQLLNEKGFVSSEGVYAEDCLIIDKPHRLTDLDEFKDGLFTIQDESSMMVSQILDPKEGSLVLDVCSAPGGKSTHSAQYMKNKGLIISRDIFEHKIKLMKENISRLGIEIIKCELFDAMKVDNNLIGKIDYCIVDAPCSGFGLIRRKPEIKWHRIEEDIQELIKIQYKILDIAKDYIKENGILLYSTCTINNEENIELIHRFLKENPNFKLESIEDKRMNDCKLPNLKDGYLQLYPNVHGTDGFFIAKIVKVKID